jgi:transcriptional antiterminator NusG
MSMAGQSLKPIGPWLVGQVVGYVERQPKYCTLGGDWYVVATEPKHENLAKGEIADAGLVPYLPMVTRFEKHGRGGLRLMTRPMFPSYILVRCAAIADHWNKITSARGVRRLLGLDGQPKPIHDGELEVIRLHEAEYAEQETERLRLEQAAAKARLGGKSGLIWHFSPGDRARIKNGPFAGFNAQLKSAVDSRDRIRALISIFGGVSHAELSAFDIEAL